MSASSRFDVLTIGNAIVDVIAPIEDDFLVAQALTKGSMRLIDTDEAERLYGLMAAGVEISGGCAGNTAAGAASFGARTAFIGKVADDHLGHVFRHDIGAAGVHFATAPLVGGAPTARSMILVSPDGERTMNTFLGACQHLTSADIDRDVVAAASIIYLEGYLWDPPEAKIAFRHAADAAHVAGRQVAMTLSDSFCVDRYREEFLDLLRSGAVDIVFANESEAKALYETADFDTAVAALRQDARLAAVTLGARGSLVVTREETWQVGVSPVEQLVDTTGAGDLYAAGFLAGLSRGQPLADCAELGGIAAGEIITHYGARPQVSLAGLARQNGFTI
ncbi:MAG: adenosine kinase [Ancalomicrobiaceae bacterium]|nr:adenosine kinase [Ancalomicrobiaceae bacterium]